MTVYFDLSRLPITGAGCVYSDKETNTPECSECNAIIYIYIYTTSNQCKPWSGKQGEVERKKIEKKKKINLMSYGTQKFLFLFFVCIQNFSINKAILYFPR